MQLDAHQQQAILAGQPIPLVIQGTECILVRRDVYNHAQNIVTEDVPNADTLYDLIQASSADDDANDPGLQLYQQYK